MRRNHLVGLGRLALVAGATFIVALLWTRGSGAIQPGEAVQPPNFLIVLTDDQRWDTLSSMPTVSQLAGRNFTNAFVTTSVCCPSRSTILTGEYARHHGVLRNQLPNGGVAAFNDGDTLATRLHDAGYRTGLMGKYLNRYGSDTSQTYIPPGWDSWAAFTGPIGYYNYTLNVDGALEPHASKIADYSTDVLALKAEAFLRTQDSHPFFLYYAPFAPHTPATPAARHTGLFTDLPPWRPASYNEADVSDKPTFIQGLPLLSATDMADGDQFRISQLQSLQAVDDAMARFLTALQDTGKLNNTVIIFLGDNGLSWGEHRWLDKKNCGYQECLRVPLTIAYPPLTPSRVDDPHIVLNEDITPTLFALAGLPIPSWVDGASVVPLLNGNASGWRTDFVTERFGNDGTEDGSSDLVPIPAFNGVRSLTWNYVEYADGSRELYDLTNDPLELNNLAGQAAYATQQAQLASRLQQLLAIPAPPMPPSGLAVAQTSPTRIKLTWTDVATNESGYVVERATGSGAFAKVGTTLPANTTSFTDTAVKSGLTYRYRVAARDTAGLSRYSGVVSVKAANATPTPTPTATATNTPTATPTPNPNATATNTPTPTSTPTATSTPNAAFPAPSNLAIVGFTASSLSLQWTDNTTSETSFTVWSSANGSTNWVKIATVGANVTTYTNTGLTTGKTYFYKVRAVDTNTQTQSDFSNVVSGAPH